MSPRSAENRPYREGFYEATTNSSREASEGTLVSDARAIFRAGVAAVAPGRAVERFLRKTDRWVWVGRHRVARARRESIHVLAIGKAAAEMADAAARCLGRTIEGGIVVQRPDDPHPDRDWTLRFGSHPLPDRSSEQSARYVLKYVGDLPPDALLLVLVSGGGSSIFEAPAEGLSMGDVRAAYARLLGSGAPIQSMNTIRRHLSRVKGGLLARAAASQTLATLAISDVVGDTPHDIASGPTVPDPTTYADALKQTRRWSLARSLPDPVMNHLRTGASGMRLETPKSGDPIFRKSSFHLVATNRLALQACNREAVQRGYGAVIVSSTLTGDTRRVARAMTRRIGHDVVMKSGRVRPMAWLAGGETTVTLGAHPGRGGRNQEFALTAAEVCDGWASVAVLSAGTDGIDGPTRAAGGVVTGRTADQARAMGVDITGSLRKHDAYPALERLNALVQTGPTGTNVMDLHVFLVGSRPTGRTSRVTPVGGAKT